MAFTSMNSRPRVPQAPDIPAASHVPELVNIPTVLPHPKEVDAAFAGNHELRKRVHAAIGELHPQQTPSPTDEP
jgi:hypothetical protein